MALKFLNKKGWHTGSLRNIENVWKAEQKHETEQKKLEELRKQIYEERERSEFRLLQEQAGLVPRQERLEFLYDSGLAVGKGSSSSAGGSGVAFQAVEESTPDTNKPSDAAASSGAKQPSAAPGALFEDKPHSANDAWRKLHSDPLLLIRQREQDALARIKNNPVQMALIRKSAEATKEGKSDDKREHKRKHCNGKARHHRHSPSEERLDLKDVHADRENKRRDKSQHTRSRQDDRYYNARGDLDENSSEMESRRREDSYRGSSNRDDRFPNRSSDLKAAKDYDKDTIRKNNDKLKREKHSFDDQTGGRKDTEHRSSTNRKERGTISSSEARSCNSSVTFQQDSHYKRHKVAPKLSEEERAAKLQEMQANALLHEEQRWKRLRRAEEDDAKEAARASVPGGKNFLDAAQRNIYGAEKGGSSTIEESVRRRAYYSQGRSEAGDRNAFRR